MILTQELSFEVMPKAIGQLLNEVAEIKKLLIFKPPSEPGERSLSVEMAIKVFADNGIMISKSKLYKLTSKQKIPCYRFNQRLIFKKSELIDWIELQIKDNDTRNKSVEVISKSANSKLKKRNYGR